VSGGVLTTVRPWSPPGPVAAAAFASWESPILLMGPVGSGKTGTFVWKAVTGTLMQHPWADGIRRARLLVVREDYRRLWANFLPSWWEWIPQEEPDNGITWIGSRGGPAMQVIVIGTADGGRAILEAHFMALGDDFSEAAMEAFFAGLPFTWIWFNEWHTIPRIAHGKAFQRVGRYPRAADAVVVGPGVWGDLNAPIVDTFHHELLTSNVLIRGKHVFRQPGAFEPGAENMRNLPKGYHQSMMSNMDQGEIERKVHNKFGRRLDGEPVWNFDDDVFVAPGPLEPDYRRPLLIGLDAGLDPAAVLAQRRIDRQLRVLGELVTEVHGVGPERFGRALGQLLDQQRFVPFRRAGMIEAAADPAAQYGADGEVGEPTWITRVAKEANITIRPAPTNALQPRLQGVRDCLVVIEGVPMMQLDPACVHVRRALNGAYRWRKLRIVGLDRYDPEPEKGQASHTADALQYVSLLDGGYERARGRDPVEGNAVRAMMQRAGLIGRPGLPGMDEIRGRTQMQVPLTIGR
jgi:hypothetical protein